MWDLVMLSKVLTTAVVLSVMLQNCSCGAESSATGVSEERASQAVQNIDNTPESSSQPHQVATIFDGVVLESEPRGGIKIKIKKPKLKKAKKFLKKFLPFLLIPLIVQAKMIPLFLLKLTLLALKALGVGKLALIIIVINLVYTAMHGAQNADQQQTKEVNLLAAQHYGFNGGPEYGAWFNNRRYMEEPQSP
ncbi:uncharacterized protein LOC124362616 [Homalodisca vitripennis]|uniref:uncharacterized protein LOC124362616 n=1 Tax=Homalodisca vitripennis TaxID=197043 RepID=UPI001EEBFE80|nr:uncharacterized protein LOC124362616 [Homalodisca vitripennis]XP_046673241.1 uncharacterized protein LOC124362616 [Homalodisca vitripennis]KAG8281862.1 hypothetical protein J6590_049926 [Homalodisca vitripennis]